MNGLRIWTMPKFALVWLLRAYKALLSPMLPPSCRYVPSCSEYAIEAVDRYGVWQGGVKSLARLLRCHPFVHGGYDPVVKGDQSSLLCKDSMLISSASHLSSQES